MLLIDVNALIEESESGGWDVDIEELRMILKYVPTIEAVPVVRGEWIEDSVYGDKIACSNCRCEANCTGRFEEKIDYDWAKNLISNGYVEIREYTKTNFCPNCGALMEDKP